MFGSDLDFMTVTKKYTFHKKISFIPDFPPFLTNFAFMFGSYLDFITITKKDTFHKKCIFFLIFLHFLQILRLCLAVILTL